MYSLRSHVIFARNINKNLSMVDFYILKKETNKIISSAYLKKPIIMEFSNHENVYVIALKVLKSILQVVAEDFSTINKTVVVSNEDFFKIIGQYVNYHLLCRYSKHNKKMLKMILDTVCKKKHSHEELVSYLMKNQLKTEKDKILEISEKMTQEIVEISHICDENSLNFKISAREVVEVKNKMQEKLTGVFFERFLLQDTKYSVEEKEEILSSLFALRKGENNKYLKDRKKEEVVLNDSEERNIYVSKALSKILLKKPNIIVYDVHTDASLNGNKAGLGAVICGVDSKTGKKKMIVRMAGMQFIPTKNKMNVQLAELKAVHAAIKYFEHKIAKKSEDILLRIFSDNLGCVKSLQGESSWSWNEDIKNILADIKSSQVRLMYGFEKGHFGNKFNEIAHDLSRVGRIFTKDKIIRVN